LTKTPVHVKQGQGTLQRFKVLVIDDEPGFLEMLNLALSIEGFSVIVASNAASGLRAAFQSKPDAILLDVMMPDMDGYEVCRRLREMTDAPIIFVTAKDTPDDILHGFSMGADDYVVKPFQISELLCRLEVSLQRTAQRYEDDPNLLFVTDSLMLDCDRREMVHGNQIVHFTPLEFSVLRLLIHHSGKVLSPDAVLTQVWGYEQAGNLELVKQYIYRLRRKIEPDPDNPRYLHTVWGEGYYFDVEPSSS
jgi:two-component system KDP operon response regulator KdpE